ncbi:putative DNA ligase I [Trypanosoma theileri]|uniref:Putative DNA ligase I n=1 Tax=Trypanosoma theileri TaxID=67003 RepID=A0A1X0NL22_9TRYP|nr:putative DNA ligase I [Trypanosoma theileri]ORC85464.1 putative DNA ligase I [Trypanosoma theileri]
MAQTSMIVESNAGLRELVPSRTHVCLPGDPVLLLEPTAIVTLGNGLRPLPQDPVSSNSNNEGAVEGTNTFVSAEFCGPVSCSVGPNHVRRYTIDPPAARRYTYVPKDPVVAIVMKKTTNYYLCYTGAPSLAVLDALSFDGATKSSRPRLQEGDVVYAFVRPQRSETITTTTMGGPVETAGDEVELSCMAGEVGLVARDWTSADATFGPLSGGTVVRVPLPYARSLLAADGASRLLALLGDRVPFEVCIGANGLVWVCGQRSENDATAAVRRTVAVAACIVEAQDDVTVAEMEARVQSYFPNE